MKTVQVLSDKVYWVHRIGKKGKFHISQVRLGARCWFKVAENGRKLYLSDDGNHSNVRVQSDGTFCVNFTSIGVTFDVIVLRPAIPWPTFVAGAFAGIGFVFSSAFLGLITLFIHAYLTTG